MALETERRTRDYLYGRLLAIAERIEGHARGALEARSDEVEGPPGDDPLIDEERGRGDQQQSTLRRARAAVHDGQEHEPVRGHERRQEDPPKEATMDGG